jgi:hypothetical protein
MAPAWAWSFHSIHPKQPAHKLKIVTIAQSLKAFNHIIKTQNKLKSIVSVFNVHYNDLNNDFMYTQSFPACTCERERERERERITFAELCWCQDYHRSFHGSSLQKNHREREASILLLRADAGAAFRQHPSRDASSPEEVPRVRFHSLSH